MRTLLKLFGRSPFAPLQSHMEKVAICVEKLPLIFQCHLQKDDLLVQKISHEISEAEHEADITKQDIRNHLSKNLFLLIQRSDLLEILQLQDSIADAAEDIGVLLTLRDLELPSSWHAEFHAFLNKNIACFRAVKKIVQEFDELLETSFGGAEAEKVKVMVQKVAFLEHEADILQIPLLKKLFKSESELSAQVFQLWLKIFTAVSAISNISENLADRIRMTLEIN